MGSVTVLKNTETIINLQDDSSDQGWTVSGGVAFHSGCNNGFIQLKNTNGISVGKTYNISYEVVSIDSGYVRVSLGETAGQQHTTIGKKEQELVCVGNTSVKFYSTGKNAIRLLKINDKVISFTPGSVIVFNEVQKKFCGGFSFYPEMMGSLKSKMIAFKDGSLWLCNTNEVRNLFFGQKYPSKVTFYVNSNPTEFKMFHSMNVVSNKSWICPTNENIVIKPYEGKSLGMKSRLKSKKFIPLQGSYYADFLRNVLDPSYATEIERLMFGEELKGRIMQITIENNDDVEVSLFSVAVKYSKQNYTL
jgi:hypothetical protein